MSTTTQHHPSLHGKAVLVTGAASGLGAALARRLAASGASIVGVDLQAARLAQRQRLPCQQVGPAGSVARAACRTTPREHPHYRRHRRRHAHALPARPLPRPRRRQPARPGRRGRGDPLGAGAAAHHRGGRTHRPAAARNFLATK